MIRQVCYLSYFTEQSGFIFPYELPQHYYAPGLFLIEQEHSGEHAYSYSFDAMDNGKRVTLQLIRVDEGNPYSTLYVVRTTHYGSFWFNVEKINPRLRYIGQNPKLTNHSDLSLVKTTDSDKLERICKNYDFFFIGSMLREDES
ncbi:hypothetical protein V3H41_24600 [Vibrio parahaemolyticus]|uniref:hypothetical protein n=1 Tax=Vibrio parahaemolyticus TaxID=670 RepID=UPI0008FC9312|nr:hypothetical protein [Vibrio parahaemolyticus]APC87705.1 hypothetical protein FORC22_1844 [Vibrio parahaemolyticus]EHR5480198.1 hypothetical protein [Vibrio parahaemolyticus]